ncbi:Flp pilus assembly protein, pilin Flp [Thalassovita litoralis]|uniref:Flp pilus assembly protein, pilin Flp n=2 Tax=Thalassovita litoralis TaxID=1010611 RepID=A0A521E9D7_9RHOB|nr:Flp pilus assembly protein, pilin Flp [Thalassovita litoralis]
MRGLSVSKRFKLNLKRDITMIKFIKNFRNDEDGAVTVDWVVLTAAVVGLAIAAFSAVETSTSGLTTEMTTALDGADATTTIGG